MFNANDLEKMLAALPEDRNQTLVLAHANQDLDYYQDRRLESCEAFDLVYRCIYDSLPGCNHDCCCG